MRSRVVTVVVRSRVVTVVGGDGIAARDPWPSVFIYNAMEKRLSGAPPNTCKHHSS